jgi:hypothetical protein
MQIRAGEIVHLNSGSPDLKILRIDSDKAKVEWLACLKRVTAIRCAEVASV